MRKNYRLYDKYEKNLRSWILAGKTQEWIAEQIGVEHQTISKWCNRFGIKCHKTGPRQGPGHPEWKGGKRLDRDGYFLIYSPGHPNARKPSKKYVLEHRLVMEKYVGRYLTSHEVVHHKDGDKRNNHIENLELFEKNSDHLRHELSGKIPKWTQAGRQRTLVGVRQYWSNYRLAKESGECHNRKGFDRLRKRP